MPDSPAPIPPTRPPNQLNPPRLRSSCSTGSSCRCSATHSSFAPTRPPRTPATAASTPVSGRLDRSSSRRKIQTPTNAATAIIAPKLVSSNEPMRSRTGNMIRSFLQSYATHEVRKALIVSYRVEYRVGPKLDEIRIGLGVRSFKPLERAVGIATRGINPRDVVRRDVTLALADHFPENSVHRRRHVRNGIGLRQSGERLGAAPRQLDRAAHLVDGFTCRSRLHQD